MLFRSIPLRRQLIVEEHGTLGYPEGTACADVLIAGDRGGSFASRVFLGLGLGGVYAFFQNENLFAAWPGQPNYEPDFGSQHILKGAAIRADATAEYMGVGYIIGPRTAGILLAGGVFSWLVLMPLIHFFGAGLDHPVYPGTKLISAMSPSELWSTYIRPMGAGAVAAAGLITLVKTLPTIVGALAGGLGKMRKKGGAQPKAIRTEDDLPASVVIGGSILLVAIMFFFLEFKPVPGTYVGAWANLAASLLVVVFGFLFVTVSARIVGLIGSSASPVSGMTIATLMATSAIFLVKGWTAPAYGALAITVGGAVCIAASNAGDTSQDLKTGYLIGATPRLQQIALMIGVCVSTVVIGLTLNVMNTGLQEFRLAPQTWNMSVPHAGVNVQNDAKLPQQIPVVDPADKSRTKTMHPASEYVVLNALGSAEIADGKYLYSPATGKIEVQWIQGIGSEKAAAPQARLMATVINGILTQKLPWGLVLMGVFLVIAVELLGIRSLPLAVGAYLSIGTTLAIFTGGMVRLLVDAAAKRAGHQAEDSEVSPGALYASGLIAAGGIFGLLGVAIKAYEQLTDSRVPIQFPESNFLHHDWVSVVMFGMLAFSLYYFARKPLKS